MPKISTCGEVVASPPLLVTTKGANLPGSDQVGCSEHPGPEALLVAQSNGDGPPAVMAGSPAMRVVVIRVWVSVAYIMAEREVSLNCQPLRHLGSTITVSRCFKPVISTFVVSGSIVGSRNCICHQRQR